MEVGSFEDMMREFRQVTDYTDENGNCSNCGNCCSDILPVSNNEIKKIRKYISTNKIAESKHFNPLLLNQPTFDLTCPFRDETNKRCSIYSARPAICKCFQCNKSPDDIERNKELFEETRRTISMRNTFFKK